MSEPRITTIPIQWVVRADGELIGDVLRGSPGRFDALPLSDPQGLAYRNYGSVRAAALAIGRWQRRRRVVR